MKKSELRSIIKECINENFVTTNIQEYDLEDIIKSSVKEYLQGLPHLKLDDYTISSISSGVANLISTKLIQKKLLNVR